MANLLQKLLKNQSHRRIITSFHNQTLPNLSISPLLHHPHINNTNLDDGSNPNPIMGFQSKEKSVAHCDQLQIYPSFPFGFCLNPISASGLETFPLNNDKVDDDVVEADESNMIWADSVKKKRKKKMNKHKLKKLKKRLRRKTK